MIYELAADASIGAGLNKGHVCEANDPATPMSCVLYSLGNTKAKAGFFWSRDAEGEWFNVKALTEFYLS